MEIEEWCEEEAKLQLLHIGLHGRLIEIDFFWTYNHSCTLAGISSGLCEGSRLDTIWNSGYTYLRAQHLNFYQ